MRPLILLVDLMVLLTVVVLTAYGSNSIKLLMSLFVVLTTVGRSQEPNDSSLRGDPDSAAKMHMAILTWKMANCDVLADSLRQPRSGRAHAACLDTIGRHAGLRPGLSPEDSVWAGLKEREPRKPNNFNYAPGTSTHQLARMKILVNDLYTIEDAEQGFYLANGVFTTNVNRLRPYLRREPTGGYRLEINFVGRDSDDQAIALGAQMYPSGPFPGNGDAVSCSLHVNPGSEYAAECQ